MAAAHLSPARRGAIGVSAGALLLVAAACGHAATGSSSASGSGSGSNASSAKSSSAMAMGTVEAKKTNLGTVLVDAKGQTLYMFAIDTKDHSKCAGQCLTYWPVATAPSGTPTAGPGVTAKLGVIMRSDGTRQLTADGLPLYRYIGDKAAGDTHGQGVNGFGGPWWVLSSSGTPVTGKSAAKPSPAKSSGSSGSSKSGSGSSGGGWA